jgi:hypothetical protein
LRRNVHSQVVKKASYYRERSSPPVPEFTAMADGTKNERRDRRQRSQTR